MQCGSKNITDFFVFSFRLGIPLIIWCPKMRRLLFLEWRLLFLECRWRTTWSDRMKDLFLKHRTCLDFLLPTCIFHVWFGFNFIHYILIIVNAIIFLHDIVHAIIFLHNNSVYSFGKCWIWISYINIWNPFLNFNDRSSKLRVGFETGRKWNGGLFCFHAWRCRFSFWSDRFIYYLRSFWKLILSHD
jgi:hypothetical protein